MEESIRRRRERRRPVWWLLFLVDLCFVAACHQPFAQVNSADTRAASEPPDPWTQEGLEYQPEMGALQRRVRPQDAVKPGTTAWAMSPDPVPPLRADSPGALLGALVHAQSWAGVLGVAAWEETLRVLPASGDVAEGVVLQWGFMDDAVAGRDFRVFMRRRAETWTIDRIEQRYHCRRAVGADQRCQ